MISKTKLVAEIIELYDRCERYEERINSLCKGELLEIVTPTNFQEELDKEAKGLLFKAYFYDWKLPNVEVREDDGQFNFLTFEQWLKLITRSNFTTKLDEISLTDIKGYFRDQLLERFNKLVNDKKMELVRAAKEN